MKLNVEKPCVMFKPDGEETENRPLLSLLPPPLPPKNGSINRPLLASFIASILSFASGTVVAGWTAPKTPVAVGETLFSTFTMEQSSWVVSIYVIGALVGALPAGQISQTIGRKKFLMSLAVPMSVGWLLIMFFVNDVYVIYAGRLLCGLSLGAVTVAVPLYNYDVAPDVCRGRSGVFLDFMLCAGVLYSYVASSLMGLFWFSFTCHLIPVGFCALFSSMPESPEYLHRQGRYAEAKSALIWLRGEKFDVKGEFNTYVRLRTGDDDVRLLAESGTKKVDRRQSFTKAIVLSFVLATIQRMSGAGAIIQFTAKLFEISGSSVKPITASIITGIFQLVGSGVAVFLIDKMGRRKLLLVSSSAVVTCLFALTLYFYCLGQGTLGNSLKILPIVIVCTFISFFRLGLGPIPWFMTSELMGTDKKNCAQSYVASYSWILSFLVMKTFLPLVNEWPVALWFGYSILSVLGLIFIFFFIPETNNRSADEIRLSLFKTFQNTS